MVGAIWSFLIYIMSFPLESRLILVLGIKFICSHDHLCDLTLAHVSCFIQVTLIMVSHAFVVHWLMFHSSFIDLSFHLIHIFVIQVFHISFMLHLFQDHIGFIVHLIHVLWCIQDLYFKLIFKHDFWKKCDNLNLKSYFIRTFLQKKIHSIHKGHWITLSIHVPLNTTKKYIFLHKLTFGQLLIFWSTS